MKQAAPPTSHAMRALAALLCLVLSSCVSLDYRLDGIDLPLSAKPAPAGVATKAFKIERKNVLWCHGLFGHSQPQVAALLQAELADAKAVHRLRISQAGSFHDWLLTHLSATLVRMKTVTIEGELELRR